MDEGGLHEEPVHSSRVCVPIVWLQKVWAITKEIGQHRKTLGQVNELLRATSQG